MNTHNAPLQSSPRSVKVTYSRKPKRKRELSKDTENRSARDSEESDSESAAPASVKVSPTNSKKLSDMRPPDSVIPVASRPNKEFKRPRVDSEDPETASVKSKKTHVRGSSSVASSKQILLMAKLTPPTSTKKPASVRGKPVSSISQPRITPSESDIDDGASVADSIISTNRVRRTEAERVEYFKNQPECGSLEPTRVKCIRCQKYISLGRKTTYNVGPWEKHRAKCDLKPAVEQQDSPEGGDEETRSESVTPSRPHRTADERKAVLLADPNIQEVKTDEVLCKKCNSWIRLVSGRSYDLRNWNRHNKSCGAAVPSSRVATAERKLKLVNDPRVKSFGTSFVVCAACDTKIELMNDVDYNLTLWEEHKAGCAETQSDKSSIPSPTQSAKAPTSVGSSTSTVIHTEEPVAKGVKRRLEDDDVDLPEDDPDARPQNRPRTENYVAPNNEPPSVLGWFMMPFKSFMRGFKESLSS